MDCKSELNDVINAWGYADTLLSMRALMLAERKAQDDPNVMNAWDYAAARVTEAANELNKVGI